MKRLFMLGSLALFSCSEAPRSLVTAMDMAVPSPPDLSSVEAGVFQPMAPNIMTVAPKSISTNGGGQITVTGGPFYPTTVFFINGALTQVVSVSSTQAVLSAPPRLGIGPAKISATNPNGLSSSNSNMAGSASAFSFFSSQVTFSQAAYATLAARPRGAAFGDLNGDGITDVVITHKDVQTYTVFLGAGGGTFTPLPQPNPTTFTTLGNQIPNQTTKLVDLNGDGKLDLLLGTDSATVHYYLGNGTGRVDQVTNLTYGTSSQVLAQTIADINGDTYPDIISANVGASNIGFFLNTNVSGNLFSGGQYMVVNPGGQPTRVLTADLDGDKKQDLVASMQNNNGPSLAVYMGTGVQATPFTAATPLNYGVNASNQTPQWFELGDVNGDGKIDCVVSDFTTSTIRIFLGTGTANPAFNAPLTPIAVGVNPEELALGDFNGDGKTDIVVANTASNNISVLLGLGDGSFPTRQDFTSVNSPWAVYALDFNGDNRLDIAVVNQLNSANGTTPGNLTIYLNTSQ